MPYDKIEYEDISEAIRTFGEKPPTTLCRRRQADKVIFK